MELLNSNFVKLPKAKRDYYQICLVSVTGPYQAKQKKTFIYFTKSVFTNLGVNLSSKCFASYSYLENLEYKL